MSHLRSRMTYRPRVRPACTLAILRFQQGVERLDHVERSMNEYPVDGSKETVMVDGVRDDPLIRMRLAKSRNAVRTTPDLRINSGN